MRRRTLSRRTKAAALIVVVYLAAFVLAVIVSTAADAEIGTAQHGPIRPAGSYRE